MCIYIQYVRVLLTECSAGECLWNKAWDARHWTPWWTTRSTQRVLLLKMERMYEYTKVRPICSHIAAHLAKLSQNVFTRSTHTHTNTLMLNWHRGVSHAEGMLCSEELTWGTNIKWTQVFTSAHQTAPDIRNLEICVTKISIYEIFHVAVALWMLMTKIH